MMMNARSDMQSGAVSADKAAETLTIVTQPHSLTPHDDDYDDDSDDHGEDNHYDYHHDDVVKVNDQNGRWFN